MSKSYSGADGKVFVGDKDCDVQGWTATPAVNTYDSTTTGDDGWDDTSPATQKLSGSFDVFFNKDKPTTDTGATGLGLRQGAVVALELYLSKTDDVKLAGNALITQLSIKSATKAGITIAVSFENKGPWLLPGDEFTP